MKFLARLAFGLLAILLVIFIGFATWEPFFATRGEAPQYKEYSAEIVRDEYGVPMIYGETDADVAYGVAIAHAEDDFFTLQDVVSMTRGRYGAIAGEDGAAVDYLYHLLDARGTAEREYASLPEDTRAVYEAYATGLNQYAAEHPGEVKLSNLFPVDGEDIAVGFVLRQPLFFGLGNVVGQLVGGEELRPEHGPDIPGFPRDHRPPRTDDPQPDRPQAPASEAEEVASRSGLVLPLWEEAQHLGSNAFAVAPEKSGDTTTLVSNTHQPLRGGVSWYELGVHSGSGWHVVGANLPGTPFPTLGHNETLGWTYTVNTPDIIDVYELNVGKEVVGADQKLVYELDGEWLELEEDTFTLPVRMGPVVLPIRRTVYRSAHGPVIKNDNGYFAIRYGGMESVAPMDAFYRLGKARNMEEWMAVYERLDIPNFNAVYADREGNIAYIYNAAFPNRPEDVEANWRGVLDGTRSDLIWEGSVGFDRIPKIINPSSGWLYNSNNTPFTAAGASDDLDPQDFSPVLGIEMKQTNRSWRAWKLLSEAGTLDRETLEAIKYDKAYERRGYVAYLFDALDELGDEGELAPDLREARDLLLTWDFTADGVGRADALALLMIRDYMSADYGNGNPPDTAEHLRKAVDHLKEHFGRIDPPMSELLRLRQGDVDLPLYGGSDTIRAMTTWDVEDDGRLSLKHGDSFIQWTEWPADGGQNGGRVTSRSVHPFGSSTTRPRSRHYTDQMELYATERMKPVRFWDEDVRAHATSTRRVTNAR